MPHALAGAVKVSRFDHSCMKFFIAVIFVLISAHAFCQDKYYHQGSYWVRYYNQSKISERTVIHFHLDERRLVNPSRQFQLFTHLHVNYKAKPWLEIGIGGNFNWTNSAINRSLRVPEWRPWQEANLTKDISSTWQFQFRYRLDERFIHNNNKIELENGYHFYLRHRFRIQFARILKSWEGGKSLSLRLSDEIMFNTGNVPHSFDQNRVFASLEHRFNNHWSVETGYLNLFQPRNDDGYYDRHIIRVTVHHRVDYRRSTE